MRRYTKIPVTVEAIQFTGSVENADLLQEWAGASIHITRNISLFDSSDDYFFLEVSTPEGVLTASLNDWIIKTKEGAFYPCKPDFFKMHYALEEIPTSPPLDNRWQTPHLMEKTLHNPVPYASLFGDGTFKLISQEQSEGCTSYTRAMEIVGVGCIIKVTTHRESPDVCSYSVAEALTFVPCSRIEEDIDAETGKVTARHIVGDEQ